MATLDNVMEMQKQGMQDADIAKKLTDEGTSPQEINDALNQAKVKAAVSQDIFPEPQQMPAAPQAPQVPAEQGQPEQPGQPMAQEMQGMEQSMMQPGAMPPPGETPAEGMPPEQMPAAPQAPQVPPAEQAQAQPGQPEQYYPETPQAYPQEAYYPGQAAITPDTVTEIAEQIVSEKFREFKEKVGDISTFKTNIEERIKDLGDRLKRIEDSIDKLQQAVIGKIGEFGETASHVHQDLDNLHNTVSKLMNPLIDNYKELKKIRESLGPEAEDQASSAKRA